MSVSMEAVTVPTAHAIMNLHLPTVPQPAQQQKHGFLLSRKLLFPALLQGHPEETVGLSKRGLHTAHPRTLLL